MKTFVFGFLLSVFGSLVSFTTYSDFTTTPPDTDPPATQANSASARARAFLQTQNAHLRPLAATDVPALPSVSPIAERRGVSVTSPFGMRRHPIHKVRRLHSGQDFAAPMGTLVYATADGEVEKVVYNNDGSGYGNYIIIRHDDVIEGETYRTLYAHLSRILVRLGQRVEREQRIARSGNTGSSTNPHLHYEVHRNGKAVDPDDYLL